MSEVIVQLLTKAEARALTDKIKSAGGELAEMLWRAHEGEAFRVLGYADWKQYVKSELQISEQRSFQLLSFVEIRKSLDSTVVESLPSGERQTRPLTKLETPEQQREAWQEAVASAPEGKVTAKHVEAAVEKVQSRVRPIVSEPTPAQQAAVDEAENDSENMWLAKRAVRKLTKKERAALIEWMSTALN